jgi:hypothetical protein
MQAVDLCYQRVLNSTGFCNKVITVISWSKLLMCHWDQSVARSFKQWAIKTIRRLQGYCNQLITVIVTIGQGNQLVAVIILSLWSVGHQKMGRCN